MAQEEQLGDNSGDPERRIQGYNHLLLKKKKNLDWLYDHTPSKQNGLKEWWNSGDTNPYTNWRTALMLVPASAFSGDLVCGLFALAL
jgi:hypothetical protein